MFHTTGNVSLALNMVALFVGFLGIIFISPVCFVLMIIFFLKHLASRN